MRLRLLREDEPRGNVKFSLHIGQKTIEATTDGDGWIREEIPADAKTAKLILQPENEEAEEYELSLGHLDPLEESSGVADRLQNLGFYFGFDDEEKEDDAALKHAVEGFQNKFELPETGAVDAATLDKLKQIHGS